MDAQLSAICEAARTRGFVLHGSGIVRHGKANLFLASSGGGKSTVASLSEDDGALVLADEFALVVESPSGFHIRPLPRQAPTIPASVPLGERSRLRNAFFLEKASHPRLEPISALMAAARCLKEAGILGFEAWPPSHRQAALDRLFRLFRAVPAYVLHFRKDNSFWKVIDELDAKNELEEKERTERYGA